MADQKLVHWPPSRREVCLLLGRGLEPGFLISGNSKEETPTQLLVTGVDCRKGSTGPAACTCPKHACGGARRPPILFLNLSSPPAMRPKINYRAKCSVPPSLPLLFLSTRTRLRRFNVTAAGPEPGLACTCATHSRHDRPPQSRVFLRQEFEDAWHSGQVTTGFFPIWGRAEAIPRWNAPRLSVFNLCRRGPDRIWSGMSVSPSGYFIRPIVAASCFLHLPLCPDIAMRPLSCTRCTRLPGLGEVNSFLPDHPSLSRRLRR